MSENIPKNQVRSINKITEHEHEDKADAKRVILVDEDGDFHDITNPVPVTGTLVPAPAAPSYPIIYNLTITNANTEYSLALPNNVVGFNVKDRQGDAVTKVAFNPGETTSNYITIRPGTNWNISSIFFSGGVIYFNSNKPNRVLEIQVWAQ